MSRSSRRSRVYICLPALLMSSSCGNDDGNDDSSDEAPLAACGNGTLDPDESCDDGNTRSGDGCSSRCESAGTVLGCTTLIEGPGEGADDRVNALLQLEDGSFVAGGSITVDGEGVAWVGRYRASGEQLWLSMLPATEDAPYGSEILELVEEPGRGYWAFLRNSTQEIIHIDDSGQVDEKIVLQDLVAAENVVDYVHLRGLLYLDSHLWLAGGARDGDTPESDMWLGILDHEANTLTTKLFEDYAGYPDMIEAIAYDGDEIAVAATAETSPAHDWDLVLQPRAEVLLIRFDRNGSEIERATYSEEPAPIATRAVALTSDGEGGWVVAGDQYDTTSSAFFDSSALVTRFHATSGWTWKSTGPYGGNVDIASIVSAEREIAVVGGAFAGSGYVSWMLGLGEDGNLDWQRHEADVGYPSTEEHAAVRNLEGGLRVAGRAWIPGSKSVLRSCVIAQ
ncbi:MAG: DUF4215 domain-containing protein [Deltaproteobacteria bacterium]|nr:DUF4215 domain-containing protein [Deltaproteobacteria bacterium]